MINPSVHRTRQKSNATRYVRDLVRVMVLSHRYSARGGALPSEAALMLELGTTRNVVRDALGLLREEGFIERLQGAGTFVANEKLLHRFDVLHGVGDGYPDRRQRIRGELASVEVIPSPPLVASKLRLTAGDPCLRVDAWVGFDDAPYSLSTSYLPASLEHRFRDVSFSGDWYELLEAMGLRLTRSAMSVEATVADELVAPWLGVAAGAPLMLFTRLITGEDGTPVEYSFVRVRGDRVMLHVPLPRATTTYDHEPDEETL